jgi:hypothetical protein
MGNVTFKVDDTYSLSVYQDDQTGQIECVPVYTEGGLIGEPLFFTHFEELIEMYDSIMNGDFKIWTDQYEVELEWQE